MVRRDESKGPLLALRVFLCLRDVGVDLEAWMAADGPLRRTLGHESRRAGLDRVRLVGLLNPMELAAQLRFTTVCLATPRLEGISRALIEAIACGVPVVTHDVGNVRSVLQLASGAPVTDRDPEALGAAIRGFPGGTNPAEAAASLAPGTLVPHLLDELEEAVLSNAGPVE
jgi:glycosyltransferase involved in cell wall biosynthesis